MSLFVGSTVVDEVDEQAGQDSTHSGHHTGLQHLGPGCHYIPGDIHSGTFSTGRPEEMQLGLESALFLKYVDTERRNWF